MRHLSENLWTKFQQYVLATTGDKQRNFLPTECLLGRKVSNVCFSAICTGVYDYLITSLPVNGLFVAIASTDLG